MRNYTFHPANGGKQVKRTLLVSALVFVFVFALAATAFATTVTGSATSPSVIAADGQSTFTYKDLQDSTAKYQGGYAAFNGGGVLYANDGSAYGDVTQNMPGSGPHGGYDTATNKCQVCHAVHRAEGAYYLLRADSQDDACDYCHIGGSAHSGKTVYFANAAGTATTNGHTMGASSAIPDSTDKMWTTSVTLSAVASDGVTTLTQDIAVRSYDTTENQMYRLEPSNHSNGVGHPLESGSNYATTPMWDRVGPLALRCSNCHQVHDALAQVWHPVAYNGSQGATYTANGADGTAPSTGFLLYGWNLLRRYPSAGVSGAPTVDTSHGYLARYSTSQLIKVPESTLTAGINYSASASNDGTYTENGVVSTRPTWEVSTGWSDTTPNQINNLNTSVWCADCHNLNIGGTTKLNYTELGFRSHSERTHPAPFAHGGQCYSCHRDDLGATLSNVAGQVVTTAKANDSSCAQCHYAAATSRLR